MYVLEIILTISLSETQGEPLPSSADPRSRTSSVTSDGLNRSVKMETSSQPSLGMGSVGDSLGSPGKSLTPKANENQGAPSDFNQMSGDFAASNYSNIGHSNKRSRSVALPETYNTLPPRNAPPRPGTGGFDLPTSNHGFDEPSQPPGFAEIYTEGPGSGYHSYPATPQLHLLRIPEEHPVVPGLSYAHETSPWCSSASSTASTQSEGSRNAPYWSRGEDRTASTVSMSDWPVPVAGVPQWSHTILATPQDVSNSGFDSILDHYEGPYTTISRAIPPCPRTMLNVSSSAGFYPMDAVVGIPTMSAYKPFASSLSSIGQFTDSTLEVAQRKKSLVGSPHLGDLSINTLTSYASQTQDLEVYIESYFLHFHQFFPLVHRPSFDKNNDNLLTFAMAAIGTQYHSTIEARTKGSELNRFTRRGIDLVRFPLLAHYFILLAKQI